MGILSKILPGILGRNVSLYGWPMLAVGIGPDGNAKAVSVDAGGKLIVEGSVTVPEGVPIQPDQAYVNATARYFAGIAAGLSFDISNCGIETIASIHLYTWIAGSVSTICTSYDANGNNMSDPDQVEAFLEELFHAGVNNATVDVSGENMAVPAGTMPHRDAIFTLTLPETPAFAGPYLFGSAQWSIAFDNTIAVEASRGGTDGAIVIGVSDSPTRVQMAAALAAQLGGLYPADLDPDFTVTDNMDGSVTVRDGYENNYPSTLNDQGSGIEGTETQTGQAAALSSGVQALINTTCTVITS